MSQALQVLSGFHPSQAETLSHAQYASLCTCSTPFLSLCFVTIAETVLYVPNYPHFLWDTLEGCPFQFRWGHMSSSGQWHLGGYVRHFLIWLLARPVCGILHVLPSSSDGRVRKTSRSHGLWRHNMKESWVTEGPILSLNWERSVLSCKSLRWACLL